MKLSYCFALVVLLLAGCTTSRTSDHGLVLVSPGQQATIGNDFTVESRGRGPLVIRPKVHLRQVDPAEAEYIRATVAEMDAAVRDLKKP